MSQQNVAEIGVQYLVASESNAVAAGFKQTEVGVIPKDWNIKTVYELAEYQKSLFDDGDWIEAEHITDKGIRLIQTGNIGVGQYVEKEVKKFIFETSFEKLKCKQLCEGDLLICRLAEPAGRACILPNIGESKVITSVDVTIFRPATETTNREFYNQYFSSSEWFKSVLEQVGGTTHKRISRGALGRIPVPYPSLEEQTAIANALSDVDALINSLEKLIAKKQAIKTATMQQLLTGKTRLPQFATHPDGTSKGYKQSELGEIPEDWGVHPIAELVENIIDYRGRTPKKLGMDWGGGDIAALSAGNVKKGYIDFSSECYFGSEALYKKWMTNGNPKKGDIVFTMEAPLGNVAIIPDDRKYIMSQRTILLQIDSNQFDSSYIYHMLLSDLFQLRLSDNATGSTAQGIKRTRFEELQISAPNSKEEQKQIAELISDVENELQAIRSRLDKTRQIKQGMMQELLTGKTRLVKPAESAA